jgi:cytochrome oxidase assembly protein ShyY1
MIDGMKLKIHIETHTHTAPLFLTKREKPHIREKFVSYTNVSQTGQLHVEKRKAWSTK